MNNTASSPWIKYGIIGGVVIFIATLLIIVKLQHDMIFKQTALEQSIVEMKQLNEGIVRNQASYVSKDDLEKFATQQNINLDIIKKDLKSLNGQIVGISDFVVTTPGYHGTGLGSSHQVPRTQTDTRTNVNESVDPYHYQTFAQLLDLNEPLSNKQNIPFGQVTFKAWEAHPWDLNIFARTYKVDTVLAEDENGRHFVYNKFSIAVNGTTYPVTINQATFVEQYPESKFSFNPRLSMGVSGGIVLDGPNPEVTPYLEVNLISHGKSKVQPDWNILGLGLGYESQTKAMAILIKPVAYNIGQLLPLTHNIYFGPSVGFDTKAKFSVLIGLQANL